LNDSSKHRLKYKLRAKIIDGSGNPRPMHPMIAKKMLVISHLPLNPRLNIQMDLEGKVKTLFFKQGSTRMSVVFNKDTFVVTNRLSLDVKLTILNAIKILSVSSSSSKERLMLYLSAAIGSKSSNRF